MNFQKDLSIQNGLCFFVVDLSQSHLSFDHKKYPILVAIKEDEFAITMQNRTQVVAAGCSISLRLF